MYSQELIKRLSDFRVGVLEKQIKSSRTHIIYLHLMFSFITISIMLMLYAGNKYNLTFVFFIAGIFFNKLIAIAVKIFHTRKSLFNSRKLYKEMRIGNDWKPWIHDNLES